MSEFVRAGGTISQTLTEPENAATGLRQGAARVVFARPGGAGRTVVERSQARSPMRVLTPENAGDGAWVYLSAFGGGLLSGDVIEVDVEVGVGALAYVSTQSATKVFRSVAGRVTEQTLTARVEEGGLLMLLPDPVSCFAESRYRQRQRIELSGSGSVVMLDWVTSGRHARGERWAAAACSSANDIHRDGRCVLRDRLRIPAGGRWLGMDHVNCFATLVLMGTHAALKDACEGPRAAEMMRAVIDRRAATRFGISPVAGGMVVRVAGPDVEAVARVVFPFLDFLVPVLGEAPWKRKW